MIQILDNKVRKARKNHICDYCNGIIYDGESYNWEKIINDGEIYEWKSHKKCSFLASAIWDYADPDGGMDSDMFCENLHDICQTFICPDCPKYDREQECCEDDNTYCIDKSYEFFKTHELYRYGIDKLYREIWKVREIERKVK